ncbi:MAG: DUF3052 domain-containing protein [Myxococcaceae bacterium]|nr:DUF3052 domain-containing protein [Myxococcaceae bacterium]
MKLGLINPPEGFVELLSPLPAGCEWLPSAKTGLDITLFFASRKVELVEKLPSLAQGMAVTGSIWVCYVPGAENPAVPTEEFIRLAALEMGLVDNKRAILTSKWAGLRLVWRPRTPRLEKPQIQV